MNKDILKNIFTKDHPLGDEKIPSGKDGYDFVVEELLFTNNLPYKMLFSKPNIIIGRRGAGKTSILNSYYLRKKHDDSLIVNLPQNLLFTPFIVAANELSENVIFVEDVSPIWEFALCNCLVSNISKFINGINGFDKENNIIQKYIEGIKVDKRAIDDLDYRDIISESMKVLKKDSIFKLPSIRYGDSTYPEIFSIINSILSQIDKSAIILLDSLEQMKLDKEEMYPSLSALLRALQYFNKPSSRIDIICAMPAEIYFPIYEEISSAPIKDFSGAQIIHWSAMEILQIVAFRLKTYLLLAENQEITEWVNDLNLNKRQDIHAFFHKLIPEKITNGVDIEEETFAYILRHTQLLPRHLIAIFNKIFSNKTALEIFQNKIPNSEIIRNIHEAEILISTDILTGYYNRYAGENKFSAFNHATEVCERVLRELNMEFSLEDIKKINKNLIKNSIPYIVDEHDIMRVLLEIGAVGRKIPTDSKTYKEAVFEYMTPHKVVYKNSDKFLIHPCFVGKFCVQPRNLGFAVYPVGSRLDENDYRSWKNQVS